MALSFSAAGRSAGTHTLTTVTNTLIYIHIPYVHTCTDFRRIWQGRVLY